MKAILICLLFLGVLSCHSSNEEKEGEPSIEDTSSTDKVLKLYSVDSIFSEYLPDTSRLFKDADELRQYFLSNRKEFERFCKKLEAASGNNDSAILACRQAEILYQDLTEAYYMKFLRNSKRDSRSLNLLGAFSPYSQIVSIQDRKDLFHDFPEKLKEGNIGKKTWNKILEYSFDKNLGRSIRQFKDISILKADLSAITFEETVHPNYTYTIIVFGASWCIPCRLEEKQLKYWWPLIDTSLVRIIGLSIDTNREKWIEYLNKDRFPWETYLLTDGINSKMVRELAFDGIPMNFLVNAEGQILEQNTDIRKILRKIPELKTK